MSERFKCDRRGGMNFARYMRRRQWTCAGCNQSQDFAGHRCQYCRRRICCACYHHEEGVCLDAGSDTSVSDTPNPANQIICPRTFMNG